MHPQERRPVLESLDQVAERFNQSVRNVRHLLQHLAQAKEEHFERALASLETLPLTTADFGTAKCRVQNAQTSKACGDLGPAHYELNLLANWLATELHRHQR